MGNLNWRLDAHMRERAYPDQVSRDAARAGYSDGFYGYPRNAGDWPVQPYSAAYWTGRADRENADA
jgi:hypothetical protein